MSRRVFTDQQRLQRSMLRADQTAMPIVPLNRAHQYRIPTQHWNEFERYAPETASIATDEVGALMDLQIQPTLHPDPLTVDILRSRRLRNGMTILSRNEQMWKADADGVETPLTDTVFPHGYYIRDWCMTGYDQVLIVACMYQGDEYLVMFLRAEHEIYQLNSHLKRPINDRGRLVKTFDPYGFAVFDYGLLTISMYRCVMNPASGLLEFETVKNIRLHPDWEDFSAYALFFNGRKLVVIGHEAGRIDASTSWENRRFQHPRNVILYMTIDENDVQSAVVLPNPPIPRLPVRLPGAPPLSQLTEDAYYNRLMML